MGKKIPAVGDGSSDDFEIEQLDESQVPDDFSVEELEEIRCLAVDALGWIEFRNVVDSGDPAEFRKTIKEGWELKSYPRGDALGAIIRLLECLVRNGWVQPRLFANSKFRRREVPPRWRKSMAMLNTCVPLLLDDCDLGSDNSFTFHRDSMIRGLMRMDHFPFDFQMQRPCRTTEALRLVVGAMPMASNDVGTSVVVVDDALPPLDSHDQRILAVMAARYPALSTLDDFDDLNMGRSKVSAVINEFIAGGLAARPKGPKSGARLTLKGLALARYSNKSVTK